MRRLSFAVLACALLLAGCKVDATLTIAVHDDGGGTVRVRVAADAEAVRNAEAGGGKLEDRVRLGDLQTAGWTVSPWRRTSDGGASLTLRKDFANAGELAGVIDELNGANGPLRNVKLARDRGLVATDYELSGVADLSQLTAGVAADPDVVAQLTAQRVDVAQVEQRLAQEINDAFRLRIRLVAPGGDTKVIDATPGKRVSLATSTSQLDTTRVALLAVAVVLGLAGVVLFVRGERRSRRRRHPRA
ncbi:MAG TPA: hypothetical protein VKI01_02810 [Acidimicrobiia bacterium]|nr:hypothetical protein [Acidimicrobiia bacterium]